MLDMFLVKGAITQAQYDKSLSDLIEKTDSVKFTPLAKVHPLN